VKQYTITMVGMGEIVPNCDKCKELLSLANSDHVIGHLFAHNLEKHLQSAHSHAYVSLTNKVMDGGWYSTSDNVITEV